MTSPIHLDTSPLQTAKRFYNAAETLVNRWQQYDEWRTGAAMTEDDIRQTLTAAVPSPPGVPASDRVFWAMADAVLVANDWEGTYEDQLLAIEAVKVVDAFVPGMVTELADALEGGRGNGNWLAVAYERTVENLYNAADAILATVPGASARVAVMTNSRGALAVDPLAADLLHRVDSPPADLSRALAKAALVMPHLSAARTTSAARPPGR